MLSFWHECAGNSIDLYLSFKMILDWPGWNTYFGSSNQPDIENISTWNGDKMGGTVVNNACERLKGWFWHSHGLFMADPFPIQVLDTYIFAFWAKTSVDPEPRRVRLKSSSYTTNNILDTLTAATIQVQYFPCLVTLHYVLITEPIELCGWGLGGIILCLIFVSHLSFVVAYIVACRL